MGAKIFLMGAIFLLSACATIQPPDFQGWYSYLEALKGQDFNTDRKLKQWVFVNSKQHTNPQNWIFLWSADDNPNNAKFRLWIYGKKEKREDGWTVTSTVLRFYERSVSDWTLLHREYWGEKDLPHCKDGYKKLWKEGSVFHQKLVAFAKIIGETKEVKIHTLCGKK